MTHQSRPAAEFTRIFQLNRFSICSRIAFLFTVSVFLAAFLLPLTAQKDDSRFDLLIRGGQIVDGTGNPWFFGDVAIKGDRIVEIGRNISDSAIKIIDARGLVIAPGFIDIHSHSDQVTIQGHEA